MPKGDNFKGGANMATRFTSERQPENRKQPQVNIVEAVRKLMEGEGWAIVEAELLDENDRPTGKKVKVRFKTPTVEAAAQAWASKVSKADPKLLEMYLDRTLGKVPQRTEISGGLSLDSIHSAPISAEQVDEIERILANGRSDKNSVPAVSGK